MGTVKASSRVPVEIVCTWVDAFNARDLDGMLGCVDEDVEFRPLKLAGVDGSYRGHDGVQRWFVRLAELGDQHLIGLDDVHVASGGQVIAAGEVRWGKSWLAPFCGVHRLTGDRLMFVRQYLIDLELLDRLGVLR